METPVAKSIKSSARFTNVPACLMAI